MLIVLAWAVTRPAETLITLRELPNVSAEVIDGQGKLFRVEEPFLYNRKTKLAVFVVEILSSSNFGDERHLSFGGDAKSLESFAHEIQFVNSGANRAASAAGGVAEGVESIVAGLWQLIRHPIDTLQGLGGAAYDLGVYLKNTPVVQVRGDVENLANAFYVNRACETAAKRGIDYFEIKTDHAKDAVHTEVNWTLGGQTTVELATFLVPFSKFKYGGEAAKVGETVNAAEKVAHAGRTAEALAEAGTIDSRAAKFAKVGSFFPQTMERMTATMQRLKYAAKPARIFVRPATFGEATTTDYAATFFAKYPGLKGDVVIHHAVERQALKLYPGVLTEGKLHSLENLRGIPKHLDASLHKSHIAREWNDFYRLNPASTMTEQKLLAKATDIDRKFGHLFRPPLR